jgi:hypothetical protein
LKVVHDASDVLAADAFAVVAALVGVAVHDVVGHAEIVANLVSNNL